MIVSSEKKFIFVANLKTASTSIEHILGVYADIWLKDSEFGKHFRMSEIQTLLKAFPRVYQELPFFKFGVMREPADYLWSLYVAHKSSHMIGTELSTTNMSTKRFLSTWCEKFSHQVQPQRYMFVDAHGRIIVNFIAQYGSLHQDLLKVSEFIGVNFESLPKLNISPRIKKLNYFDDDDLAKIRDVYEEDYFFYENKTSKLQNFDIKFL